MQKLKSLQDVIIALSGSSKAHNWKVAVVATATCQGTTFLMVSSTT